MQNSPSWEATSCSATHSIPCLLHNTSVHYYFHHSLTHTLSPNFFSPPTHLLFSHIFFTEQHRYYSSHVQCTSNAMLTHQNEGKKKWDTDWSSNPLSNAPISNWKKQLTQLQPQTPYPTIHTLNINNETKRTWLTITNTTCNLRRLYWTGTTKTLT